jgi:hypothetical protein
MLAILVRSLRFKIISNELLIENKLRIIVLRKRRLRTEIKNFALFRVVV